MFMAIHHPHLLLWPGCSAHLWPARPGRQGTALGQQTLTTRHHAHVCGHAASGKNLQRVHRGLPRPLTASRLKRSVIDQLVSSQAVSRSILHDTCYNLSPLLLQPQLAIWVHSLLLTSGKQLSYCLQPPRSVSKPYTQQFITSEFARLAPPPCLRLLLPLPACSCSCQTRC